MSDFLVWHMLGHSGAAQRASVFRERNEDEVRVYVT